MEINIHEQRLHCICTHLAIFSSCSWCSLEGFSNPEHQPRLMWGLCVCLLGFSSLCWWRAALYTSVGDSCLSSVGKAFTFVTSSSVVWTFSGFTSTHDGSIQNPLVEKNAVKTMYCGDSILIGHLYFTSDFTCGRIHRDTVSVQPCTRFLYLRSKHEAIILFFFFSAFCLWKIFYYY